MTWLQQKLEIQKNWGFILTTGVADILAGYAAIAAPIYATAIAQVTQLAALFIIGFTNILSTFYVEKGLKVRSLLLGVAQVAMGIVLGNNPVEFRYLATLFIASLGFADGLYRLVLAVQNADLTEHGWTIFTGLVSMADSSLVAANLDGCYLNVRPWYGSWAVCLSERAEGAYSSLFVDVQMPMQFSILPVLLHNTPCMCYVFISVSGDTNEFLVIQ